VDKNEFPVVRIGCLMVMVNIVVFLFVAGVIAWLVRWVIRTA